MALEQERLRRAGTKAAALLQVVVASSFAPLLNNVHGTRWSYNLINFNSTHLFTLPSYGVIEMFR